MDEALRLSMETCGEVIGTVEKVRGGRGNELQLVSVVAELTHTAQTGAEYAISLYNSLWAFKARARRAAPGRRLNHQEDGPAGRLAACVRARACARPGSARCRVIAAAAHADYDAGGDRAQPGAAARRAQGEGARASEQHSGHVRGAAASPSCAPHTLAPAPRARQMPRL